MSIQVRVSRETRERLERLRRATPGCGRSLGDLIGMLSLATPADVAKIFRAASQTYRDPDDDDGEGLYAPDGTMRQ